LEIKSNTHEYRKAAAVNHFSVEIDATYRMNTNPRYRMNVVPMLFTLVLLELVNVNMTVIVDVDQQRGCALDIQTPVGLGKVT